MLQPSRVRQSSSPSPSEHKLENIRFFRTPAQSSFLNKELCCWRFHREKNTNHFHVFWTSPQLQQHWSQLKIAIGRIFKITVPFSFEILYLRLRADTLDEFENKYLYKI